MIEIIKKFNRDKYFYTDGVAESGKRGRIFIWEDG
jgi:hypothetical protein